MERIKGKVMIRRRKSRATVELNMTPLIDMIFILLIFFMVTASFVRESGIDVERPVAETGGVQNPTAVVSIDAGNVIWVESQTIDIRSVRTWMSKFVTENPQGVVIVAADAMARNGVLIQVLDACRAAGAKNVSVATKAPS